MAGSEGEGGRGEGEDIGEGGGGCHSQGALAWK